jgi:hypothetical protein
MYSVYANVNRAVDGDPVTACDSLLGDTWAALES